MAKDHVPIPDDLAAEVMFAADRTCCVCRLEKHKVQIHHIDGDPSQQRHREFSGDLIEGRPYRSADDLERVKGIGKRRLEEIRGLVTVE